MAFDLVTSHLLCWVSAGGTTNSPSHVLYMGISYSCEHAHRTLNYTQLIIIWCHLTSSFYVIWLHSMSFNLIIQHHLTSFDVVWRHHLMSFDVIICCNLSLSFDLIIWCHLTSYNVIDLCSGGNTHSSVLALLSCLLWVYFRHMFQRYCRALASHFDKLSWTTSL